MVRSWKTLILLLVAAPLAAQSLDAPLPDPKEFGRKVREAVQLDYELQKDYTYIEERRDVKMSKLGKVTVGPLRRFEVYPSNQPGKTYKRLVAIDGKPLPADELARRDEEHRLHMIALAEQEQHLTAEARAARAKKEADERREREAIMNDAFNVFDAKIVGRELLHGHRVIVTTLTPRPDAKAKTREGKWLKSFAGRAWIAENDYQVVRIELEALDDISIGWGIVGRVHKGSRFAFTRQKVDDEVWLPAEAKFDASGRTLIFRKFSINNVTTFSGYRKWSVDTNVTYTMPKTDDH